MTRGRNSGPIYDSQCKLNSRGAREGSAHLRALRTTLTQARDVLMHFNGDHLDLDRLEPAARRVDDLMNLFAGEVRDSAQGPVWIADDASLG